MLLKLKGRKLIKATQSQKILEYALMKKEKNQSARNKECNKSIENNLK